MTKPTKSISVCEAALQTQLNKLSFANCGDDIERENFARLNTSCPNIEVFWREFVFPLTNRMAPDGLNEEIHFRDGVDPLLQYIAAANYSLFVNLALAQEALNAWSTLTQDAIFGRLASACDVFEAMIIRFHVLISECQSLPPKPISDLTREEFLNYAGEHYDKHYATLKQHYLSIGKPPPPIRIPSNDSIIDEFFNSSGIKNNYRKAAGDVRTFRNPMLHDVRLGMLRSSDGSMLVPKPEALYKYKKWFEVEAASKNSVIVKKDFSDAKVLCGELAEALMSAINDTYITLLQLFRTELHSTKSNKMRELFGLRFDTALAVTSINISPKLHTNISSSFQTTNVSGVSGLYPFPSQVFPDV